MERDAIGEIANISMGSSATTLYSLVNRKVNITTPVVTLAHWKNVLDEYEKPCVFIQIKYTKGLDGTNILVLRDHDVKIITDLMMGGDGTNTDGELGELHLSAISEAMNQMMGSASTSLSTMLDKTIDISPPESSLIDLTEYHSGSDIAPFLGGTFVKIAFRMQIGDLVDSTIMQLYPIEFARKHRRDLLSTPRWDSLGGSHDQAAMSGKHTCSRSSSAEQRRTDECRRKRYDSDEYAAAGSHGHESYEWHESGGQHGHATDERHEPDAWHEPDGWHGPESDAWHGHEQHGPDGDEWLPSTWECSRWGAWECNRRMAWA